MTTKTDPQMQPFSLSERWERAVVKARGQAEKMYPPHMEAEIRETEKHLALKYYRQMTLPDDA